MRASKYRHVYGQVAKKERQYENIRLTNNAWDSNLIKVNPKFISVNWNSSGGGAFAVIPLNEVGKAPDQVPLFRGHTAHVLDTDFDPFNDNIVASGSDDGKIGIWEIPEDYSFHHYTNSEGEPRDLQPKKFLTGHGRKVGHVLFHPTARNVLASSSLDHTVRIWDVESGKELFTLKHPDMVTSMSFSYDGNHLATVSRDKKLRVWDIREEKIVSEGQAHTGAKNQRVVWLGNSDRLATTGFSKLSDRQIGIWDAFGLEKGDLGGFYTVDQSSGILMPFFDDSNKILYLVGKGDGNIRYYEFQNDELFELSEFQSIDPQRGFAAAPRRAVSVKDNEVLKAYKTVNDHCIEPISFYVPRKSDSFQEDIYPDAPSGTAALTADEWVSKKPVDGPVLFNMSSLYNGSEPVLKPTEKTSSPSAADKASPSVPAAKPEKDSSKEKNDKSPTKEEQTEVAEASQTQSSSVAREVGALGSSSSTLSSDANDALKEDKSVDKLLQKSSELDSVNGAEDPSKETSGWDDEDDEIETVKFEQTDKKAADKTETSVKDLKTENKCEVEKPKSEVEGSELKPETPALKPKEQEVRQQKQENGSPATLQRKPEAAETKTAAAGSQNASNQENPAEKKTAAAKATSTKAEQASSAPKSLGLKQSVEKLSDLVLELDRVVADLRQSNLDKDNRLKALEAKIEQLVKAEN